MSLIDKITSDIKIVEPSTSMVSQLFGQNIYHDSQGRTYKQLFGMDGHNGIDYANKRGDTIIAPCDIEIVSVIRDDGYGNTVWARSKASSIYHGEEYKLEFVFGHLSGFIKEKGDVEMGRLIARTGNTGKYTTGPHLHFGTRIIKRDGASDNWYAINKDNGYLGYVDPKLFTAKSYKDIPLVFVKDWITNAVYQLGVGGEYMEHSDPQLFQRLYGKFSNMNIERLKAELPYTPERMTIASLDKFKRIFKV